MKDQSGLIECYQFSKTASDEPPDIFSGESVKDWLKDKFEGGLVPGLDQLMEHGLYKTSGWEFDLRPHLTQYLYKQHGEWAEVWAPNRTALRRAVCGRIDRIVDL